MTLLDKYLIKKFIYILFFGILAFIIIFIVIDVIENIDKFIDRKADTSTVFLYYLYYIPYIISLTLPISMLLSSLFSIGNMTQHNEIVAQKSAGISLYRIFTPIFISAFVISILAGIFSETLVPWSNQQRLDIMRYEIKRNPRNMNQNRSNINLQDMQNRKISIGFFNAKSLEARKVSILTFDGKKLIERIDAPSMKWDNEIWMLKDVVKRTIQDSAVAIERFEILPKLDLLFKPENLVELQKNPEEMSYFELKEFVDDKLKIGAEVRKWVVEIYLKISYPFANFIIVLFGAPIAARKRRSGPAVGIGISLLVCFVYFLFVRTGQVLGHQGTLEPWLGAWFGNIIFGVLGIFTLIKSRM